MLVFIFSELFVGKIHVENIDSLLKENTLSLGIILVLNLNNMIYYDNIIY